MQLDEFLGFYNQHPIRFEDLGLDPATLRHVKDGIYAVLPQCYVFTTPRQSEESYRTMPAWAGIYGLLWAIDDRAAIATIRYNTLSEPPAPFPRVVPPPLLTAGEPRVDYEDFEPIFKDSHLNFCCLPPTDKTKPIILEREGPEELDTHYCFPVHDYDPAKIGACIAIYFACPRYC